MKLHGFATKHGQNVNDGTNYRILNVWKKQHREVQLGWKLFKSEDKEWTVEGTFKSEVEKIGPYSVVTDGLSFWIGWDGIDHAQPKAILSFSFKEMNFSQSFSPGGQLHPIRP
ncbi:hypothetical protein PIB30_101069 [Stylosanthes scabra]|uniref:Uncharacterized protein n=1 Tax=Stylosanthes scabra TaxID=79078 RepID=A0ABU6RXH6_9FABA|nr:hypothetical protein [Stylosanthes scabra]